ncbi:MAG: toxin glutamine deamidase domain-containing protein [Candidatus Gastranaerophilaceae bacterium]|nr:toxin glutamine deamidase domain-containing protein [Candidatus Gastranaerophilaceae bacterium]
MDIRSNIRSFNTRVNLAKFPIPKNITLQFINNTVIKKGYVAKTDYSEDFEQIKNEILRDLIDLRKKIHKDLDKVKYSEIVNKKEELLNDIKTLETDVKNYIEQIRGLNNNDDDFFQQKSMELSSFNSKITEINDKLAQIKKHYGILNKDSLLTGAAANITQINEESPTIAGVKRGKPMDPIEANEGKVNPNHYHNNCQSCVAVYEARLRGYNISVMPKNDETSEIMTKLSHQPNLVYIDPTTGEHPKMERSRVSNAEDCRTWLENKVKKGERYAFAFSYKGNGDNGHMYVVYRNHKNELVFYDPQNGNGYNMLHLNNMEYYVDMGDYKIDYSPIIFRIDNTNLNIEIMNKISQPYQ